MPTTDDKIINFNWLYVLIIYCKMDISLISTICFGLEIVSSINQVVNLPSNITTFILILFNHYANHKFFLA